MALTIDRLTRGWKLLTGQFLARAEARQRAQLLGSRDELLTTLIVKENVFGKHERLMATLKGLAGSVCIRATAARPNHGELSTAQRTALALATSLEGLIKSEEDRVAVANAAHDAMKEHVMWWFDSKTHPGYHWRVANEKS